ncbi:regulator of G-protein signaling 5 isoform X2 [Petaurus breviceps papuanus]|uniref:regulator of G-protein signaling 5 isoform X2 n=2 Tax=Petaurus breviceps papuanus TaxID=3040969 RepID=UPI0036DEA8A6
MCKGLGALPQSCLERAKEIKTKLGTLLQKPDATIDFIIPYPDKPEKPVKTQKPSPEEALQWRDSLEKLLQNSYGLASFKSFLKSEFSEENIEFWIACEDYKKTKSPIKMAEKAKKIYEEFIRTEAPKEKLPVTPTFTNQRLDQSATNNIKIIPESSKPTLAHICWVPLYVRYNEEHKEGSLNGTVS